MLRSLPGVTAHPASDPDRDRVDAAVWRIAAVLLLGPVLALLDSTIVSVGLDSVARELGSPLTTVQWISTGYLLAVALVMPLTSWATERFGGKAVWMASVALFTAGSALCGAAWSAPALIAFRVLQGIGGGMIQPVAQSMLAQAAGPRRLGRVIGVTVLPITLAPVAGPVLGGLIVRNLDWRWMFYVNVPIGIAAFLLAARVLPTTPRPSGRTPLDLTGLALLAPGLAALMYGCAQSSWGVLLTGAALTAGYVGYALRQRGHTPLIDVRLFARRGFAAATASSFVLGGSLYSAMLLLPLYFQQVCGADAMSAGLRLAPQAVGTAAVSLLAGRLGDRHGPRPLMLAGLALALLGTLPFAFLGRGPANWLLATALLVRGAGLGLAMVPGMSAVYAAVAPEEAPKAAGTVNVVNRLGGSLGTAVLTVLLQHQLTSAAGPAAAYGYAFGWALVLSSVAFVPALYYPARKNM
ncbi:MDR family MFS transporter [Streptantibioticus rubrisoli]|uniref:Multidrug efflux MFS transporter n=1 Tax=Streptantibioticus rubrisoli TaxID=1387313 RepID=A0ABT1PDR4_9ACTN|nr:MDR family MFS transporter [Streptantibioticus rubrisoli]MCQ4042373.1 multidrug efflux MFS transporter [Streptantibioticus rubrisoli]